MRPDVQVQSPSALEPHANNVHRKSDTGYETCIPVETMEHDTGMATSSVTVNSAEAAA